MKNMNIPMKKITSKKIILRHLNQSLSLKRKLQKKKENEATEELPPPKRKQGRPRKTDTQTEKKQFPTLKDTDECYQLLKQGKEKQIVSRRRKRERKQGGGEVD